jgi:hypothetical protein
LHHDITESWSHLRFKIMLQNIVRNTPDSDLSHLSNSQSRCKITSNPSANDYQESHHHRNPKQLEDGNEEVLILFETDSQALPPEGALNRYRLSQITRSACLLRTLLAQHCKAALYGFDTHKLWIYITLTHHTALYGTGT